MVVFVSQFFKHRQGELDHDGRTAHDGIGVIGRLGGHFFRDGGNKTHMVFPVGCFRIHGEMHVDVIAFFPFNKLVFVKQHAGCTGAIDHVNGAVIRTVGRIEHHFDGRP